MHNHHSFKIRMAELSDVHCIVEIFKKNYNTSYIYADYLDDNLLSALFKEDKPITFIAEYDQKIIGHIALIQFGSKYEIGRFLVDPDYKDLGVGKLIYKKLLNHIKNNKIENIYTECVTNNGRSSNIAYKNGLRTIGFGLGTYKNFYQETPPRETMIDMIIPKKVSSPLVSIYCPLNLTELFNIVYKHHHKKRNIINNLVIPDNNESKFTFVENIRNKRIEIYVSSIGVNIKYDLLDLIHTSLNKKYAFVKCILDLSDPHSNYAATELQEIGFYFSSLWPNYMKDTACTDLLTMQYTTPHNIFTFDNLAMNDLFTQDLLEHIKHEYLNRKGSFDSAILL